MLNKDLNARAELHSDLTDLVVPLTGFWIFVIVASCCMCSCWSVELITGFIFKSALTWFINIWYIYTGFNYTVLTFISAICENVVYSTAGDYYETSTERIFAKVEARSSVQGV